MKRSVAIFLTSSAVSLIAAMPAAAETAAPTPAPAQASPAVQDIVVTARRKDESLAKTPLTVEVLTADVLAKNQIVSENDLRAVLPGLAVRNNSNSNQINYAIRGNTQDAFSGTRPGVLPYVNEVQIGGAGGSSAFYDLQSVQVVKGPQGTLFGRSATGGAVLFTTAKPTDDFGGYASALAGNYAALKFEGALNIPVVHDKLLLRVAGFYQRRNGFQFNTYDDQREGDFHREGGRISLTAKPTDSIRNELVFDYYHFNGSSTEAVISGLIPLSATPGQPPFIPLQYLYGGTATPAATATGIATLQAFTGAPYAAAAAYYEGYFANPKHPNIGVQGLLAQQQANGPYLIDADGANVHRANNYIVTNATTFDLGNSTVLKNIFGYTHLYSFTDYENDGLPYGVAQTGNIGAPYGFIETTRQLSDEIQIQGKALNKRLDYVTGFYFSDENDKNANSLQFFDIFFGGSLSLYHFIQKNRTYAGYGQGTYKLNDSGLAVTLGARYTSEKVTKIKLPDDANVLALGPVAPAGYSYDQSTTYNRLSWNIGVEDQIDPNLLVYAASRRAYKSGGYVGTSLPKVGFANIGGDAFKAERVTDIETGAKFQGQLAQMPARLNIAGYYQWIVDSQRTAYVLAANGPAAVTVNVPTETAYGLEADGQIKPGAWLTLGGNLNYIHPRFGSTPVDANGTTEVFDQVPDTPTVTGLAYADVTVPVTQHVAAIVHGEVYAQAKTFIAPRSQNDFGTVVPSYALVNFRAGVQDDAAGWSVTANLKNAFNKIYYTGGIPPGEIYQLNVLVPGDRRTITVEARLKF